LRFLAAIHSAAFTRFRSAGGPAPAALTHDESHQIFPMLALLFLRCDRGTGRAPSAAFTRFFAPFALFCGDAM